MKRVFKVVGCGLVSIVVIGGIGAGLVWLRSRTIAPHAEQSAVPTTSPTETATTEPTPTATSTLTHTPTLTFTPTSTRTPTVTVTSTPTSTLSTLVLRVNVVNADVTLEAGAAQVETETPTPLPTVSVPTPPVKVALIPLGDVPLVGWFERDVTDPAIQRQGQWQSFTATYRSANKRYLYSDDDGARLTYRFLGAAIRVRYVAYHTYGVFQVLIDGQVRATIDSYYPKQVDGRGNFLSTPVLGLAHGWHVLDIVRMGRKAPESAGSLIAIDAVDVYLNGPEPTAAPALIPLTPTSTASPAPARQVQLVAAPPTVQPTATAAPPSVTAVNFSLAYDLNGNKAVDPSEGVVGMPVYLVTADTNEVAASGYTNGEGVVHLEVTTNAPLRLVVPYLSRYWDLARGVTTRITLLIPPANQPGLIP